MSLSIVSLPVDMLCEIAIDLVKDPKSLVAFGKTCRLAHEVVQGLLLLQITVREEGVEKRQFIFANVIALCKEEIAAKKYLPQLMGPSGSDGLVYQAFKELNSARVAVVDLYAPKFVNIESQKLKQDRRDSKKNLALEKLKQDRRDSEKKLTLARKTWQILSDQLSSLAQFDKEGGIVGGRIYDLPKEIENEFKNVQNKLKEGGL
jgi:hypothetical protein